MKKSFLLTLGLMLGLVGLVAALDRQAEITGASRYKKVTYTTTRTPITTTGTIVFEGILVASCAVDDTPSYVQIWDSTSTTAGDGTKICEISLTTSVVLGGVSAVTVSLGNVYNFEYKPVTPIILNRSGLYVVNSDVGFDATILYKKFN